MTGSGHDSMTINLNFDRVLERTGAVQPQPTPGNTMNHSLITTRQLWSVLPYVARRALIPEDMYDDYPQLDSGTWTHDRIQVSPWYVLPHEVKEAIHGMVACVEMEGQE
jgi:hypothetical protein